jgi:murein L,D-transpeptidase YafK
MLNRATKRRFTLILLLGLGASYLLALHRNLIPSIGEMLALRTPIVCPADPRYHAPPPSFLNAEKSIAQLLPNAFDRNKITVFIEKSQYRLTVYYDQKPIKSYKVVFGASPQGDKRQEGDMKTPEGILKIKDQYPHPDWSKFLWLDYPNAQSECKHQRAKHTGEIPWNSTIGGEVGIHGVPKLGERLIDDRNNWTWGCPSLKTNDINELYDVVQIGTIVEIVA